MKLFSFLGPDCEDLLPAWLSHYHALGVSEFRLVYHGRKEDRGFIERLTGKHPITIVDSLDIPYAEAERCRHLTAAVRKCTGEWVLVADSDEFLELPYRTLKGTIAMLKAAGGDCLYAPMLQRIAKDGRLRRVEAGEDPQSLFPLCSTHLCERMGAAPLMGKYPLLFVKAETRVQKGSHHPPNGRAADELPIRGVSHHFKWRKALLDTMPERRVLEDANAHEISAYARWLERHDFRVPAEGAFPCSRANLFTQRLLRKADPVSLRRCALLRELECLAKKPEAGARAQIHARKIRERTGGALQRSGGGKSGLEPAPERLVARRLRICMVTWELFGIPESGGLATSMAALAELLASAGHEVTIYYQTPGWLGGATEDLVERYRERGIELVQGAMDTKLLCGSEWAGRSASCHRWLARQKFDVIHFPDCFGIGQYAMRAKRQGLAYEKTVLCVTLHGCKGWARKSNRHAYLAGDFDTGFLEMESARLADAVISPSQSMLDWWRSNASALPERSFVHPNILRPSCRDGESGRKARTRRKEKLNEAVYTGRLEERKGVVAFCDALDRLAESGRLPADFRATFLGRSVFIRGMTSEEYLEMRAEKWNFPWKLESNFSMQRGVEYLSQPGCFAVIPSFLDNYPNTLLECLGASIPFVSTNVGGAPEMLEPADAEEILVPPDAERLAEKIGMALERGLPVPSYAWDFTEVDLRWLEWHGEMAEVCDRAGTEAPEKLPELTVCVTATGEAKWLGEAAEALLHQTQAGLRVIIARGRLAGTEAEPMLKRAEMLCREHGWEMLHAPDASRAALMRMAAENAKTRHLLFLTERQSAGPNMAEVLLRAAVKTGAAIVTCGMLRESPGVEAHEVLPAGGTAALGALANCFGGPHFLIERKSFLALGGVSEDPAIETNEFWHLCLRALIAGEKVEVAPEVLVTDRTEEREPFPDLLLEPFLEKLPAESHEFVLLAHNMQAKTASKGSVLEGATVTASPVRRNQLSDRGVFAKYGKGWIECRESQPCAEGGSYCEILLDSPASRWINFSADIRLAEPGALLSAQLNGKPVATGFHGGHLQLQGLPLEEGKNVLRFKTEGGSLEKKEDRPRGASLFFSELYFDVCNRFGGEATELTEWCAVQREGLAEGSQLCVKEAQYRRAALEAWFGEGWYGNELTHRWSGASGSRSAIDIHVPGEASSITFCAILRPLAPDDALEISLNGEPVVTLLCEQAIRLERLALRTGANKLVFEGRRPPRRPHGSDHRLLSWMIHSVEIIQARLSE